MKKHIFAIFTYFATFFLSFFLVGLLTEKPALKATSCFPVRNFAVTEKSVLETGQQTQIRNLLTFDHKYGKEFFAGSVTGDRAAHLVEQMKGLLDNSDLPMPVRKSYSGHILAWDNYARHLGSVKDHKNSDKDCIVLNREISETYNTVLLSAKSYGVDFER